jgi:Protein-disulfide isomerase
LIRRLAALTVFFVAGLHAQDYPAPVQALVAKGVTIQAVLAAPPGFKGYVGDYQGQRMPVYLLPDGQHVLLGTLLDAHGNDLTQAPMQEAAQRQIPASTWDDLAKASWIAEGSTHPQRIVYVFTDTECPYCHKLWQATQPMLAAGSVQVRHIIVAVIAPASRHRAAAILDARDPAAALRLHESTFEHSAVQPEAKVPPATATRIAANTALMEKLGIEGTPATVYRDANGSLRILAGLPPVDVLRRIFLD